MGGVGGHGFLIPVRSYNGILGGGARKSFTQGRGSASECDRSPAATWKAKKFALASPTPRCLRLSRPMPVVEPSTVGTIHTRHWVEWFRSRTSCSAKPFSAAWAPGLYGILIYVVLAVFIAGLMVGRTPEYLGKKIEAYDVKMAMLVTLVFPLVILVLAAISSVEGFGTSSISNPGPHGLTQILYAFTSMAGNNGSAFGGLNGNTLWYNTSGAMTMLIGRFFMIIPMLAIAGNLAKKKYVPPSLGTFPVTTPLFSVLLVGVILIVGALTFFPALSLGPILEHLLMSAGKTF